MSTTPWFIGDSTRLPWRVVENEGMFEVWTANDDTPGSLNNYAIAIGIQQEDEANAIAAVPDMVAALQDVERELDNWHKWQLQTSPSYGTSQGCAHTEIRLRAARAALEKAGVKG